MDIDIDRRWPKRGDVVFGQSAFPYFDERTVACVDRLLYRPDLWIYADAFKGAADFIVAGLSEGKHPGPCDIFFFPVAYLYRHAIELLLKKGLGYAIRLQLIENDEQVQEVLGDHNLYALWNKLKPAIQACWPEAEKGSNRDAERIIAQFHEVDKSGQAFRYPARKDGAPSLKGSEKPLEVVDLLQLGNVAGGLCAYLDACASGLGDALSNVDWGEP